MIEILKAGPLTTVQDLGRPGVAHLGVGGSGAVDRPSLRLANRLVGNDEGAAALEITFGGLSVRATATTIVSLTGAPAPVRVDGRERDMFAPLVVTPGQVLEIGTPAAGVRTYLAVRGGLVVECVLGSAATDILAKLGPAVIRQGDRLRVGVARRAVPTIDVAPVPWLPDEPVLRVLPGPRADWFTEDALARLGDATFTVTSTSDRIGLRLDGPVLERRQQGELPSEGMVEGAIQVPPDGHPVVFLADHPVTGGYPVIAVVHPDDIPLAAQARPGQTVRFAVCRALAV